MTTGMGLTQVDLGAPSISQTPLAMSSHPMTSLRIKMGRTQTQCNPALVRLWVMALHSQIDPTSTVMPAKTVTH